MKLLILGGAGFIGANLACNFAKDGWMVDVVDNLVRRGSEFNLPRLKEHGVNFIHGDIRNPEDFKNLGDDYHAILLTAAQPSAVNYKNPAFDIQNNTIGVLNTLEYSRKTKIPIVFWSTNKVYPGEPCNHFAYVEKPTRYEWVDIIPRQKNNIIKPQLTPEQAVMVALHERDGFTERGITTRFNLNGGDRSIYGVSKAMADLLIQEWSDAYGIPAVINRFSCLAADTLIKTKSGDLQLINIDKDIDVQDNQGYNSTPTGVFHNGQKELFEVTTRRGFKLQSTDCHQYYTPAGYQKLENISHGSFVEINPDLRTRKHISALSDKVILSSNQYREAISNPDLLFSQKFIYKSIADLENKGLLPLKCNNPNIYKIARLLGWCFGDGHLSFKKRQRSDNGKDYFAINMQIYDEHDATLLKIRNEIKELGFHCSDIFKSNSKSELTNGKIIDGESKKICVSSIPFSFYMYLLGLPTNRKVTNQYLVPDWIKSADTDIKAEFLGGLFGAEGSCPNVVNRNRKGQEKLELQNLNMTQCKLKDHQDNLYAFMHELRDLLLEFGIGSSLHQTLKYENSDGSTSIGVELRLGSAKDTYAKFNKIGYSYNDHRQNNLMYLSEFLKEDLAISKFKDWLQLHTKDTSGEGMVWDQIVDKKSIGIHDVYDMTVENSHNFIANNFHVHNCLAGPYQWGKSEQGWVAWFVIANLLKLPVTIYGWGGKQVRDCLFMDDIQDLVLKQIQYLHNGGPSTVVNVGGGKNNTLSVLELINMVEEKTGEKFVSVDKNGEQRRADQRIYISDLDKVQRIFEWSPKVDITTGIDQILDWAKNNLNTIKELYV